MLGVASARAAGSKAVGVTSSKTDVNAESSAARGWGALGDGASSATVNRNTDPPPGADSAVSSPPIMSARRRQIDRPRPVPPCVRAVEASAWANGSKTAASRSGAIPTPVSRTENASEPPSASTWTATEPASVNLTALVSRLASTCWTRPESPVTVSGVSGSTVCASSSPLVSAWCETVASALLRTWRRS